MNIQRIARHLLVTDGQIRRAFGGDALSKIEQAIQAMDGRLTRIFQEADAAGESPVEAARRMVERRLASVRV